jgi:preprotein translocase subunit SecG
MLTWLGTNLSTILISLALLAIVVCIIVSLRKDKQNGNSSCGGSCGHCPMGSSCHSRKE